MNILLLVFLASCAGGMLAFALIEWLTFKKVSKATPKVEEKKEKSITQLIVVVVIAIVIAIVAIVGFVHLVYKEADKEYKQPRSQSWLSASM